MSEFWLNKRWPIDPVGYVFMARALEELGRARFSDEWTGLEYSIQIPQSLPPMPTDRLGERVHARNLLKIHRPDVELEPTTSGNKYVLPTVPITAEQWAIAREITKQQYDAMKPSLKRGSTIQADFAKLCEAGTLVTAYRPVRGGEMHPIPLNWWNTESCNRFAMCQLNPGDPFGVGIAGDGYGWIFVTRESLDRYLIGQPFAQSAMAIHGHLSPYMRLMLSVTQRLGITLENQPKKELLIEELRLGWPESIPRSTKLLETMATLLREPGSQLGRAKKTQR